MINPYLFTKPIFLCNGIECEESEFCKLTEI